MGMQRGHVIWNGESFAPGIAGRTQLQERDRGRESFTDSTVAAVFKSVRRLAMKQVRPLLETEFTERQLSSLFSDLTKFRIPIGVQRSSPLR